MGALCLGSTPGPTAGGGIQLVIKECADGPSQAGSFLDCNSN